MSIKAHPGQSSRGKILDGAQNWTGALVLQRLGAAFVAKPGLAVYSPGPTHYERLDGPLDGPALIAAAAIDLPGAQAGDTRERDELEECYVPRMRPRRAKARRRQHNDERRQGLDKWDDQRSARQG